MSCFNPNSVILPPIKYQLCKAAVKFTVFQTNLVKSREISTLINSSILRHPNQHSTPSVSNYMSTTKKSHSLRKVDFEKKKRCIKSLIETNMWCIVDLGNINLKYAKET